MLSKVLKMKGKIKIVIENKSQVILCKIKMIALIYIDKKCRALMEILRQKKILLIFQRLSIFD